MTTDDTSRSPSLGGEQREGPIGREPGLAIDHKLLKDGWRKCVIDSTSLSDSKLTIRYDTTAIEAKMLGPNWRGKTIFLDNPSLSKNYIWKPQRNPDGSVDIIISTVEEERRK